MVKRVFIVRHTTRQDTVQPDWTSTAECSYNPPLAEVGHKQASETGRFIRTLLPEVGPVVIHSSPFLRCVQTSAHVAEELISHSPKIRMDAALGEWLTPDYFPAGAPPDDDHADVAAQAVSALQREHKQRLLENGWNLTCLGGSGSMREFWSEMHLRFEHYLKRLVGFYAKHNRKIDTLVIVTHGAGVSSLLNHFILEPVLSEIRLGSVSLVAREDEDDVTKSPSRSRATSVSNWAWLGPDQVEEKFSVGSWALELLNATAANAVEAEANNMKRRTSSPAMFMLNTTFLGSAPPSTRTSRASSLLKPNVEGPPVASAAAAASVAAERLSGGTTLTRPGAGAANGASGTFLTPSASVPAMLGEGTEAGATEKQSVLGGRIGGNGGPVARGGPGPAAALQRDGGAATAPASGDQETPATSPVASPPSPCSPQFSSGTWLLGSNRW